MPSPDIIFGLIVGLPMLGGLAMTAFPKDWQTPLCWLGFSYLGIPLFLGVVALAVNMPIILFGALFLGGIAAAKVKR